MARHAEPGSAAARAVQTRKREWKIHGWQRLLELPVTLLAWLLAYPLGLLVPRDSRLVIVIGRGNGQFSDNTKYFYMWDPLESTCRHASLSIL